MDVGSSTDCKTSVVNIVFSISSLHALDICIIYVK